MRWINISLIIYLSAGTYVISQENNTKSTTDSNHSQIKKIGKNLYKLGNLTLNSQDSEIIIPGIINMQQGIIELLACSEGGKVHESVLVLDIIPYHLHVALLLLGLNFGGGLEYQGDPNTPKGDSVEIWVKWKIDDNDKIVRAEDLIPRNKSMEHTAWVFSGSKIIDGKYMADIEKTIITTYHDPFTILDNPMSTGANDEVYKVNETIVPPKGTPISTIIKKFNIHEKRNEKPN